MAKQETPKNGISQKDLNRVILESANRKPIEFKMAPEEVLQMPESPVSNKNQSNPGSTSGGFSYKLKND